ncbi:MAG: hypothetical protein ACR2NA_08600, partial [Solirubrobacterales bacterium]
PTISYSGTSNEIVDGAGNTPSTSGTTPTDGADPLLTSAATRDETVDGQVDRIRTTWSEKVSHPGTTGSTPFAVTSPTRSVTGVQPTSDATTLDIDVGASGAADLDLDFSLAYTPPGAGAVTDAAGNEALAASGITVTASCTDANDKANQNDTRATAYAVPAGTRFEYLCPGDEDWYQVTADGASDLNVFARPADELDIRLALFDSSGTLVGTERNDGGDGAEEATLETTPAGGPYFVRVRNVTGDFGKGDYCLSVTSSADSGCGAQSGDVLVTEVLGDNGSSGVPDFVEVTNLSPLSQELSGMTVGYGSGQCTIAHADGTSPVSIASGERMWGSSSSAAGGNFTCAGLDIPDSLANIELRKSSGLLIDDAPLAGSPSGDGHSAQTSTAGETSEAANDSAANWCYTFYDGSTTNAVHTRGAANDGCDEFRINEVNWNTSGSDEGKTFVELFGNASLTPSANLLGGYRLVYVEGRNGDPTGTGRNAGEIDAELVLPSSADPGSDGVYVIADGNGGSTVGDTIVPGADIVFENGDPEDDSDSIQLLRPGVPASSTDCGSSLSGAPFLADVFGHSSVGLGVAIDQQRKCSMWEGTHFSDPGTGDVSAERKSPGQDSNNNAVDFEIRPQPGTPGTP